MKLKLKTFFTEDIWYYHLNRLPRCKAFPLQLCRISSLTMRLFSKNQCSLRASALTFLTLLSIVPVAALLFGIAKGYGYDEILKSKLRESLIGHEQVADKIINFAETTLNNASSGLVAGIGVIFLAWTALKLFSSIESSFNDIWGLSQGRNWMRKLSDYLAMLILLPLLLIVIFSGSAFVMSKIEHVVQMLPYSDSMNQCLFLSAKMLPVVIAWGMFTFLYSFIPNTKVRFKPALIAGIITGSLYLAVQYGYMFAQGYLTSYNKIYGSFAALPFFLIWLQISWTIVVFGCQLSFAIQNVSIFEFAFTDDRMCSEYYELCAIRMCSVLVEAFRKNAGPVSLTDLSSKLEIPIRIVRGTVKILEDVRIIACINGRKDEEDACILGISPEDLTPVSILRKMSAYGDHGYRSESGKDAEKLLNRIWTDAENSPSNQHF